MNLQAFLYDSFSSTQFGGNVAGVVIVPPGLGTHTLQQLAAELNAPTTGFVEIASRDMYRVRFFSPSAEMNMCGHVTIGIAVALTNAQLIELGTVVQETNVGAISVQTEFNNGKVFARLTLPEPAFVESVDIEVERIAHLLGIPNDAIDTRIPCGIANAGLSHLFVPLLDGWLSRIQPNGPGLLELSREMGVDTIGVYQLKDSAPSPTLSVNLRDLCYGVGNPEESASGTTNGALASYLWSKSWFTQADGLYCLEAEQGRTMGRPSSIKSILRVSSGRVQSLQVEGTATKVLEGAINLQ